MRNIDPTQSDRNGNTSATDDNNIMVEDAASKFTWVPSNDGGC